MLDLGVPRFDRLGEPEIVDGVFVTAPNLGLGRQSAKLRERLRHHFHRAFEDATATRDEQRVAAKQIAFGDERDRAERVAGDLDDVYGCTAEVE